MRAKPFSGKKKKEQLQQKRSRKAEQEHDDDFSAHLVGGSIGAKEQHKKEGPNLLSQWDPRVTNIKLKPLENPLYTKPITMLEEASLEVAFDDIHGTQGFSLPSRPPWDYSLSKEELEAQEQAYFQAWLDGIYSLHPKEQLSFFEHNLEVWRQLWRVCEISQVIVVVADCRHPVLHLPPSLYKYIAEEQGKPICIALTKADIVGEQVCAEWEASLKEKFPLVHIVKCSIYNIDNEHSGPAKRYQDSFGVKELLLKINELSNNVYTGEFNQFALKKFNAPLAHAKPTADLPDDALLTIGFVGHPNAGKSSLINAIMGHKCVSASRTPGHTKHFQTLHLARHIRLCDCPGLVFPMLVPQWLQIVSGLYNIAQVQDPYGPLMRVAQHVNLPKALGIPACDSILSICEEYAKQRGFYTAKAARPDIYRAANFILRSVCDGRILVSWKPTGFYMRHPGYTYVPPASTEQVESDHSMDMDKNPEVEWPIDYEGRGAAGVAATPGGFFSLLQDSEPE